MSTYIDTSFLLKIYVFEPQSATTIELIHSFQDPIITNLTDVEVVSTLHRKLPAHQANLATANYFEDCAAGRYRKWVMADRAVQDATALAREYSGALRLRSLDLLHLAVALQAGVDSLATYDERLKLVAQAVGLSIFPTRP